MHIVLGQVCSGTLCSSSSASKAVEQAPYARFSHGLPKPQPLSLLGEGWEHLCLKGWSTFNSVFCAVEQLLKEGNHYALQQQLALLWHMLKCSQPSPGRVRNYMRCKGRCTFSIVSPVLCVPDVVLSSLFVNPNILDNMEVKGMKIIISVVIRPLSLPLNCCICSIFKRFLLKSTGCEFTRFPRKKEGRVVYCCRKKKCLALKLHLWFQLVNSQL